MFIKIVNVDVESVGSGTKTYQKAEVIYDVNGDKRTHKVMSFVNPGVFKIIAKAQKGDTFEIGVTKNAQGYNQWISAEAAESAKEGTSAPVSNAPTSSVGRSFETADEREKRQRLIVRQSSLTNAIAILAPGSKGPLDPVAVKGLAEELTNFVFEQQDLFDQPNDVD